MAGKMLIAALVVGLVAASGCSSVQKGTAVGGATGSGVGAIVGHTASGIGSGPGAVAGFGAGAIAGAIAADYYYGEDDTEDLTAASATIERLNRQLQGRDARMAELSASLQREKAQQKALLQAYDKARQGRRTLQASVPAPAQAESDKGAVTITLLSGVLFASGSTDLTQEGKAALKQAAGTVRSKYPNAAIEVRGHTDNVPIKYSSFKSNWDLSCARALAVARHLIEAEGFDPAQVTTRGYGDTRPIASNNTAAGRKKNRRAEIIVRPGGLQVADVTASD